MIGKDGESRIYRVTLSRVLLVAFVFLLLVGVTVSNLRVADAAPRPAGTSLALVQMDIPREDLGGGAGGSEQGRGPEEGGALTRYDWLDHLPLALIAALVVIAADAVTVTYIVRSRQSHQ